MAEQDHPVLSTHPHLKEFMAFLDQLRTESERGEVLICTAMIGDLLLRTLTAFLIEGESASKLLTGFNAPLGTLSARIEMAAALCLIGDDERHDATLLRKIRNDFAHNLKVSFATDTIMQRCAALRLSAKDYGDVVVPPRGQFSTAATALILNLTNRPHYVGQKRLTWQGWPY